MRSEQTHGVRMFHILMKNSLPIHDRGVAMADILTTDDVTTERISNIIHQHLAERFTSEISFGPVLPVIRTDYQEGLDYLQIYIVFDGDQDGLDPRWTVRLPARIRPQLAELGYASMPITSWVHSSEWEDLFKDEEA